MTSQNKSSSYGSTEPIIDPVDEKNTNFASSPQTKHRFIISSQKSPQSKGGKKINMKSNTKNVASDDRLPNSLAQIRRFSQKEVNYYQDIIEALHEQYDLKNFTTETVRFPLLLTLLTKIIEAWHADPRELQTLSEFQKWHAQMSLPSLLNTDPLIETLIKYFQLVDDVTGHTIRIHWRLDVALRQNVLRYCVSLHELCLTEIPFVIQYEKSIQRNRPDILQELSDLRQTHQLLRTLTDKDLVSTVQHGDDVLECIKRIRASINKLYYLTMEWTDEDADYLDKVEEELTTSYRDRDSLREQISQCQKDKFELELTVNQLTKTLHNDNRRLLLLRQQLKKSDQSMDSVQEKLTSLDEQLIAIDTKISQLEDKIKLVDTKRKKLNTPRNSDSKVGRDMSFMEQQKQNLEMNRRRIMDRRLSILKHISRLRKQRQKLLNDIHSREDRNTKWRSQLPEKRLTLKEKMEQLKILKPNYETTLLKIEDLKVLKEKKGSPSTLRELYNYGHVLPVRNDPSPLDRACEYISERILLKWKQLYPHLPMLPDRNATQREYDVNMIDMFSARHDLTAKQQALMALNKWRLFYHRCDVSHLVTGLQLAHFSQEANDVEEKFVKLHSISSSPDLKSNLEDNQSTQNNEVSH